jgi:hypothetical protein
MNRPLRTIKTTKTMTVLSPLGTGRRGDQRVGCGCGSGPVV